MPYLLTDEEKKCPECGELGSDFEVIDDISVGNCDNCDHIWPAVDLRDRPEMANSFSGSLNGPRMVNSIGDGSNTSGEFVKDGDMWIQYP